MHRPKCSTDAVIRFYRETTKDDSLEPTAEDITVLRAVLYAGTDDMAVRILLEKLWFPSKTACELCAIGMRRRYERALREVKK